MGWKSPAVHQALDLCLSCKGCARDCPTGIDMASYKSQVIDHTYKGKIRPRSHYALGWLPRWGRMITRNRLLSALINTTMATPGLRRVVRWTAGVDQRRDLPRFATRAARDRVAGAGRRRAAASCCGSTRSPTASPARASRRPSTLLTQAGYAPEFLERNACCGLTWISTGQRDGARRQLRERPRRPAPARRRRHPRRRAGAVLPRRLAQRRRRAAAGRPAGRRPGRRRADHGRAAHPDRGLAAARPQRRRAGGPAALPPRLGDRLAGRRRPAGRLGRHGDDGRRVLRPGRELRGREGPLRRLGRGRRARPAARRRSRGPTPSCWPTGSPAGRSWPSWRAGRPSPWPSCSPGP